MVRRTYFYFPKNGIRDNYHNESFNKAHEGMEIEIPIYNKRCLVHGAVKRPAARKGETKVHSVLARTTALHLTKHKKSKKPL